MTRKSDLIRKEIELIDKRINLLEKSNQPNNTKKPRLNSASIAILIAIITGMSAFFGTIYKGSVEVKQKQMEVESTLILKILGESNNSFYNRKRLKFLADIGVLSDENNLIKDYVNADTNFIPHFAKFTEDFKIISPVNNAVIEKDTFSVFGTYNNPLPKNRKVYLFAYSISTEIYFPMTKPIIFLKGKKWKGDFNLFIEGEFILEFCSVKPLTEQFLQNRFNANNYKGFKEEEFPEDIEIIDRVFITKKNNTIGFI